MNNLYKLTRRILTNKLFYQYSLNKSNHHQSIPLKKQSFHLKSRISSKTIIRSHYPLKVLKYNYSSKHFNQLSNLFAKDPEFQKKETQKYYQLSCLLFDQGNVKRAIELMEEAQLIEPLNMDILFQLSRFYLKSDMLVKYIDVFNKMIEVNQDPNNTQLLREELQKANILYEFQGRQQNPKQYPPNTFSESELRINDCYFWGIPKDQLQNDSGNQKKQQNRQILILQKQAIKFYELNQKGKFKQCYQKIKQILFKQNIPISDPLHIKNEALIKFINRDYIQSILDYKQSIKLGIDDQNLRYLLIKSYNLLQPHQRIIKEAEIYFRKYGHSSSSSRKVFLIVNDQWRHFDMQSWAMISARELKKQLNTAKHYLVDAKINMSFNNWNQALIILSKIKIDICWDIWKRSISNTDSNEQYDNIKWQLQTTLQYLSESNKNLKNYQQVVKNCTQLINNHILTKQQLFKYYDRRAYAYFDLKQYNKSLSDFEKALEIRYVQYIYFMKAKCYIEMGKMNKAAEIYNSLISNLGDKTTEMSPNTWKQVKQYFKSKGFSE